MVLPQCLSKEIYLRGRCQNFVDSYKFNAKAVRSMIGRQGVTVLI